MPIGRPISNTVVILLDDALQAVADGEEGEICFGGCLAAGYLESELTVERFVPNPYAAVMALDPLIPVAHTLFRTGDRARAGKKPRDRWGPSCYWRYPLA